MRQQAIPSSATVAVQRHQVKRCSPNLAWTRAHASSDKEQSMSDRVSNVFVRWDIFQMQSKVFSSRHFFYLFQLLIHQRTPTTVIFPGCSESHVVHPHMHSCVSDRGEKGAQSLILSLGLKGIDITFKVDP